MSSLLTLQGPGDLSTPWDHLSRVGNFSLGGKLCFLFGFVFELLVVVINVFHFLKNYSCCDVNGVNCYYSAAGVAI